MLHQMQVGFQPQLIDDSAWVAPGAVVTGRVRVAGAIVKENTVVPPRSLVLGVPGRVVRQVTDGEAQAVRDLAGRYVAYSREYMRLAGLEQRARGGGIPR